MARSGIPLAPSRLGYAQTVVLFDPYSNSHESPVFEVRDRAVLLTAYGLQSSETITVHTVYGPPGSEQTTPFVLNGTAYVINVTHNSLLLSPSGRYRLVFSGDLYLNMRCTLVVQQEKSTDIPQPSGAQANLPNQLFDGTGSTTQSPVTEITDKAWLFTAYGLTIGNTLTAYITVGVGVDYHEEPYLLNGNAVVLTSTNTSALIPQTGRFRFKASGSTAGVRLVGNPTEYDTVVGSGSAPGSGVASVVAGVGIDVDDLDPANPIVGLNADSQAAIELAKTALQGILSYSYPNGESFNLLRGMPVAVFSGQLRRATSVPPFDKCIGLIDDDPIPPGGFGKIRFEGVLSQPTAQWDIVTGMIGGLATEQMYFPNSAGQLTPTPSSTEGEVIQYVGRAVSSTDLAILLGVRIGV